MRRLVVALLVLGACSAHGPRRIGEQPSWRRTPARAGAVGGPVTFAAASGPVTLASASGPVTLASASGPVTFAPASEPAARYAEPQPPVQHTALGDAVIAAVRDAAVRAGVPAPKPDARLFQACADLAEAVPEQGVISYALVEFALQHSGIIESSPHLLVVWGDIGSPELIAEQFAPRLAEILRGGASARFGVAAARRKPDGTGAVVFALQGSAVSIVPIPRAIPGGGSVALDAVVDPRYHDPEVFVTFEGGDTRQLELRPGRPGGFVAQIACGSHEGRLQIEIVASDASGSTVLANFPV